TGARSQRVGRQQARDLPAGILFNPAIDHAKRNGKVRGKIGEAHLGAKLLARGPKERRTGFMAPLIPDAVGNRQDRAVSGRGVKLQVLRPEGAGYLIGRPGPVQGLKHLLSGPSIGSAGEEGESLRDAVGGKEDVAVLRAKEAVEIDAERRAGIRRVLGRRFRCARGSRPPGVGGWPRDPPASRRVASQPGSVPGTWAGELSCAN